MDPGSTPVAARTRSSLDSFNDLLSRLPDNNDHEHGGVREHVVINLTRFNIWAGSIGAYHVDTRSADHRLREAPEIPQRLLELLDEVLEANEEFLGIFPERVPCWSSRHDGNLDVHADEDLIELCLTIGDVMSSLLKVPGLLRKATCRDGYAKAVAPREPTFLEEFDIGHVKCKSPKVSRSPKLAEKLGRANVLRRQYRGYARKHHDRLAHDPIRPMRPVVVSVGATNTLSVSGIEQRTLTSGRPTLGQTEASSLLVDRLTQIESGGFDVENLEELQAQATSVMTSNADYREHEGLCPSLPYLQGIEYVEDILSSLAKCQAITISIAESFQRVEAGVMGQVEDDCDDSLQYIDDTVQRIMSKSSAAVEVPHEIALIRKRPNKAYGHLVNLYDRLAATFSMDSTAQSIIPHREIENLDGERTRSPGLLGPPAEASLTIRGLPEPVKFTCSSAYQRTPPAQGPDFQQVTDVLASALVQDLCERFNLWDDSRFTGALALFSDFISLVKAMYSRDAQNIHLVHRQCIEILQNLEHDVERLTRDVPIHSQALEAVAAINERLAILHELLLDVTTTANA